MYDEVPVLLVLLTRSALLVLLVRADEVLQ